MFHYREALLGSYRISNELLPLPRTCVCQALKTHNWNPLPRDGRQPQIVRANTFVLGRPQFASTLTCIRLFHVHTYMCLYIFIFWIKPMQSNCGCRWLTFTLAWESRLYFLKNDLLQAILLVIFYTFILIQCEWLVVFFVRGGGRGSEKSQVIFQINWIFLL